MKSVFMAIAVALIMFSQSIFADTNKLSITLSSLPSVSTIAPMSGSEGGGTSVIIRGTNFNNVSAVNFGSTAATSFVVVSANRINAISPVGSGAVSVTVTTTNGTSLTDPVNLFTYVPTPIITSISPASGITTGGTSVTIIGNHLGATTGVSFGLTAARSFTIDSDTQLTVVTPGGTTGSIVDITAKSAGGSSATSAADKFIFLPQPVITNITSSRGLETGDTLVTINGTGFFKATAVTFGSTAAKSFKLISQTQINAVSPAGSGIVDITVANPSAISAITPADQFTYVGIPSVTSLVTARGPITGGSSVIISGTKFSGATAVNFGTIPATAFTINSSNQMTAISPAGSGTVDVTVITLAGTSATSALDQFTYVAAPMVAAVAPINGPQTGGTSVTLSGTNFTGASAVTFGTTPAASFTVNNDNQMTAISPTGSGSADITVTTVGGTSAVSALDQFTYVAAPMISMVAPVSGPQMGGTAVSLSGTGFTGASAVLFGTTPAISFTVNNDSQITAISPTGSGSADITVTTVGGTSAMSALDQFTYVAAPAVTSLSPASGSMTGGTSVTIVGTNFNEATAVNFGTTAATSFTIVNANQIIAISPSGSNIVDITVVTAGGTSAAIPADSYTYVYIAPPIVSILSLAKGPAAGGTLITITGTNLSNATGVKFGSTKAASFTVVSATKITAVTPAGSGSINVTVTNAGGTSTISAANLFTYVPAPIVTGIAPSSGSIVGGTLVTLTGTYFTGATAVKFGSTAAQSFTLLNDTQISAVSPVGVSGKVAVSVTTVGGKSATNTANTFTYVATPVVTGITPSSGFTTGKTSITMTGSALRQATAVFFGTTPAASFQIVSNTKITAVSPAGGAGTVDVTVSNLGITSATNVADVFTYIVPVPTVTGITPSNGPVTGGSSVTISGTSLSGTTAVTFGSNAAVSFTVNNDNQITATSPAGSGTVDVTITTAGGISVINSSDRFSYAALPVVTAVMAEQGPSVGGSSVIILGDNLGGATGVAFGATPASSFKIVSANLISAVSPAGTGTVDITVTTAGGTSVMTLADQYSYVEPPTVSSVAPASGSVTGGTSVTLGGTNFNQVTAVTFGTTPAASFTVVSADQIIAISPSNSGTVDVTVTTAGGVSAQNALDQFTYLGALSGLFVGVDNGAVYYSTDSGNTWRNTAPLDGSAIQSVFALSSTVYAGTKSGGLYYSTNGGGSWAAMTAPDVGHLSVNSVFVLNNMIYAGTESGHVYRSIDNGNSWISMVSPDPSASPVKALFVVSASQLYAGTQNGNVYYSTNAGTSWVAINGQPDSSPVESIFISNNKLYIGTGNEYVYLSPSLTGGGVWGAPIAQSVYRFFITTSGSNLYVGTQGGSVFSLLPQSELGFVAQSAINSIFQIG